MNLDLTFCNYYKTYSKKCDKALTKEVKEAARINGKNLSRYLDVPECYKPKGSEK